MSFSRYFGAAGEDEPSSAFQINKIKYKKRVNSTVILFNVFTIINSRDACLYVGSFFTISTWNVDDFLLYYTKIFCKYYMQFALKNLITQNKLYPVLKVTHSNSIQ